MEGVNNLLIWATAIATLAVAILAILISIIALISLVQTRKYIHKTIKSEVRETMNKYKDDFNASLVEGKSL